MIPFKKYIAQQLVGQTLRFKCECIFAMDIIGSVEDVEIKNDEFLYTVNCNGKLITIGSNYPNMEIEQI